MNFHIIRVPALPPEKAKTHFHVAISFLLKKMIEMQALHAEKQYKTSEAIWIKVPQIYGLSLDRSTIYPPASMLMYLSFHDVAVQR